MRDPMTVANKSPSSATAVSGVLRASWRALLKPTRVLVLPGKGNLEDPRHASPDLPVPAFDAALLAWRDWCRSHAGLRCKVALSSAWTLTGMVPDHALDKSVPSATQAVDHMARQWDHYMGMSPSALSRDWVVRSTRVPGAWLVCATPRPLIDDLLALAKTQGVRVVWMGPWWTQGLQCWARKPSAASLQIMEPGWCLHVDGETGQGNKVTQLTRVWSEPVSPGEALTAGRAQTNTRLVTLGRHGTAADACVWDDAATQDLIDGKAMAWSGKGAVA